MQIVYDGHGETREDVVSVEMTAGKITNWLQAYGVTRLDTAYGCSSSGAFMGLLVAKGNIRMDCGSVGSFDFTPILSRSCPTMSMRW